MFNPASGGKHVIERFRRIVSIDRNLFAASTLSALESLSNEPLVLHSSVPDSSEEVLRRAAGADAILVTWQTKISNECLKKLTGLRCICIVGQTPGFDVEFAESIGISVSCTPWSGPHATAEFIIGELIAMMRGAACDADTGLPRQLFGKTIGIVGLGRLGWEVAAMAKAFRMTVLYSSRTPQPCAGAMGIRCVPLEELLRESDVVTLHAPGSVSVLDAASIELLKPGAIVINTCLPGAVDEDALTAWLAARRGFGIFDAVAGARFLDRVEPMPNARCLRAVSGRTAESLECLGAQIVENVSGFLWQSAMPRDRSDVQREQLRIPEELLQ